MSHSLASRFLTVLCSVLFFVCFFSLPAFAKAPLPPLPSGSCAASAEATTGMYLTGQNENNRISPGPFLSYMVAYTAYLHSSLADTLVVPQNITSVVPDSEDIVYFWPGEELTYRDCIAALLFNSQAGDAAYTLAMKVSGSVKKFVELMNDTAQVCGAENTHFSSIYSSSSSNDQMTTPKDITRIASAMWQHEELRELISADLLAIPPTNTQSETRYYVNPLDMRTPDEVNYYSYALGGKNSSGLIIVFSSDDEMALVSVISKDSYTYALYQSAIDFMDYLYEYYHRIDFTFPVQTLAQIPVYKGPDKIGFASVSMQGTLTYYDEIFSKKPTDPKGLSEVFSHTLVLPDQLSLPLDEGKEIGAVVYTSKKDPHVTVTLGAVLENVIVSENEDTSHTFLSTYSGRISTILFFIFLALSLFFVWCLLLPYLHRNHKPDQNNRSSGSSAPRSPHDR